MPPREASRSPRGKGKGVHIANEPPRRHPRYDPSFETRSKPFVRITRVAGQDKPREYERVRPFDQRRSESDSRPMMNRHGNFRQRAYDEDPKPRYSNDRGGIFRGRFDDNGELEVDDDLSDVSVQDESHASSSKKVSDLTYQQQHLQWAGKDAILRSRPPANDAAWHLCPYCIEGQPHNSPASHIAANLNVFQTLRQPPTVWNEETQRCESFFDGFSCWGLGEVKISLERSDLTGCDELELKDVCYCPGYPDAATDIDTRGYGLNVVCLTRLQQEGLIVQVQKFHRWAWVQVFDVFVNQDGRQQKVPGAPRTTYLATEHRYGVWELIMCRKPGSHRQHGHTEPAAQQKNDAGRQSRPQRGQKQQDRKSQRPQNGRNKTWKRGDPILFR